MRLLTTVAIAALVAYGAVVLVVWFGQRPMLYPGATGGPAPALAWGTPVAIATPDGETLFALHSPAAADRPTVLFLHGNADRVDRYGFLAQALAARGIGLLALSYRGYPGSTGRPTEQGLTTDGLTAYDWLAGQRSGPVVVLGQSLGTGVGVEVAAQRPVAGLVLLSAYDSIAAVAASRFWFLPVRWLIADPWLSDERIGAVQAPILMVHGRRDTLIPLVHGERLHARAPEPKSLVVVDDAGHNDLWSVELVERVIEFVDAVQRSEP